MKFYGYNKCGTCRKAKKFLEEQGVSFTEYDITETPPPKSALKRAIKERGIKKLFNTSGVQYKELKMKDKVGSMSEAEALEILSTNGRLVKRPIAFDSDSVTVGFNEDEYRSVWA
ncbi:MAG: arsenate reductase family protein [Candidatus Nitrohelix vancouverensis]|uniref:Arsenate reductase family protein n=1 Tax=Candidatus Nitrohelix vancouverensis TaxID=2705534 RepID=A0A7T0G2Z7_9BACT|nr:MAG: arsenate reductase family protein [Candidatus Nitrohelix vancouverensis]